MSTTRLRLHVGIVGREVENEKWEDAGKRGKGREWLLGRKRWHVAATAVPVHFLQPDSAQGTETSYVIHFLYLFLVSLSLQGTFNGQTSNALLFRFPNYPSFVVHIPPWGGGRITDANKHKYLTTIEHDIFCANQPAGFGQDSRASYTQKTHCLPPARPLPPGPHPFLNRDRIRVSAF